MAYMNAQRKALLAPTIHAVLKKHGLKGTLAVRTHSALVLTLQSGPIDFIGDYNARLAERNRRGSYKGAPAAGHLRVNSHWYHECFSGPALGFLDEVIQAMNTGNHNRSDIQTDYFDVGWYIDVSIGREGRPYTITKENHHEH